MAKKAVVLISGGLDSCVTTFLAREQHYEIYALSFRYGQHHTKELLCAKKIARVANVKEHLIFPVDLYRFGGSSLLTSSSKSIPTRTQNKIGKDIPSTYVPARNTVFLSLALAYAETRDADTIFIGANAVDYSGYPDCRPEYLQAFEHLANLATKKGVQGKHMKIQAPLLYLTKSEIIKQGMRLQVPFKDTWSCYRGEQKACGRCDSCLLRLKGFQEAGIPDPVPYNHYPPWYKVK
ncbi:MAG: 7-cyano-7-deazaguanine synthase QueC [Methanobacteriota archaeon]